jgi:flagellar motor switch protein FliG
MIGETAQAQLTPAQKSAILLMVLAEPEAARLLRTLAPDDVESIGHAMIEMANIDRMTAMTVLDDYARIASEKTSLTAPPPAVVEKLFHTALGEPHASLMLERMIRPAQTQAVDELNWLQEKNLAAVICDEHPQVIAVMLSLLKPAQAAVITRNLAPEIQIDVLMRMTNLTEIPADALQLLETALSTRIADTPRTTSTEIDGRQQTITLLKSLPQKDNRALLQALSAADPDLADGIRDDMFVFANLADLPPKSLQTLVSRIEGHVLAIALKGASDDLRDSILACMSARAAATITDEMEERGKMRSADVTAAQKTILALARQMADAGDISLGSTEDDDDA